MATFPTRCGAKPNVSPTGCDKTIDAETLETKINFKKFKTLKTRKMKKTFKNMANRSSPANEK